MWHRVNGTAGTGAALLSLFAGMGAVAASSCCALPLALSVAGVGGAWLGRLSALVAYRPYFLMTAAVALAVGWIVALRRSAADCTADGECIRPARSWLAVAMLGLSTVLLAVAALWGWIEPAVMAALYRLAEGAA